MVYTLFGILVTSAVEFGKGVLGRTGKILVDRLLEARTLCPRCGQERAKVVVINPATNHVRCTGCQFGIDQYTNVTEHTKRSNGALLLARLSPPVWDEWGGRLHVPFSPECTVEVVEGRGEPLIAEMTLSHAFGDPFHRARLPIRSRGARDTQSLVWSIPPAAFPNDLDVFTVDVRVMNTYGEHLDSRRDVGRVSFET